MAKETFTQRMDVAGNQLVDRVKEIAKDANARRVIIRDQHGAEILTIPLGWGAAGGAVAVMVAPWLAVLAAVGGAAAKVRIEVERVNPGSAPGQAATEGGEGGMPVIRTDAPRWDSAPDDRA